MTKQSGMIFIFPVRTTKKGAGAFAQRISRTRLATSRTFTGGGGRDTQDVVTGAAPPVRHIDVHSRFTLSRHRGSRVRGLLMRVRSGDADGPVRHGEGRRGVAHGHRELEATFASCGAIEPSLVSVCVRARVPAWRRFPRRARCDRRCLPQTTCSSSTRSCRTCQT